MKKRTFIKNLSALTLAPLVPFKKDLDSKNQIDFPVKPIDEDDFWSLVRSQYKLHPDFINLESGYYNIIPT